MVLNWGICCVGKISNDFTSAFCEFADSSIKIVAVAARDIQKAKEFAEKYEIEYSFGCYEKLAQCSNVEIIYIGSIDSEHFKLTKLFLSHGKHVLVEKPMGKNVKETNEMINLAREKNLFLMEGFWTRCFPLYSEIKNRILNGAIGSVHHVNASFQIDIEKTEIDALYRIGIYTIQLALWVFGDRKCINSSSNFVWKNENDIAGTILLEFEGGGTAFLNYHTQIDGDTSASIIGNSGNITIPKEFWCPEEFSINGKLDKSFKLERRNESFNYIFRNSWYFIHEINHVAKCIKNGMLESDLHPLKDTLEIANIIERLLSKDRHP